MILSIPSNLSQLGLPVAGLAVAALAIFLTKSFVQFYVFPRKEVLDEAFPFENTLILFREKDKLLDLVKEYFDMIKRLRGTKTFVLQVLGLPPFVITNDVANVTYVLKTNYENFGKGGSFKPKLQGLLGNGIFNSDGADWFVHRKTSAHLFKLSQFKTCVLETFHRHLSTAEEVLRARTHGCSASSVAVDLQDVFHRLTLDSIAYIAFGVSLRCLEADEAVPFAADFDYCTAHLNDSFVNPLWRIERYCTPKGWRYFAALRRINAFAAELIAGRRRIIGAEGALRSGRVDLLSLYLDKDSFAGMDDDDHAAEDRSMYMEPSDANLRDVVLNMVIAGRDTTAQALSWMFYRFTAHPAVQRSARDEVMTVLRAAYREQHPEEDAEEVSADKLLPLAAQLMSYAVLQKMRYVEACCMETLRLHPSVPKEAKAVVADDVLPDGTQVRAGDILSFMPWVMGRETDLWGADAEEYRPQRFLDTPRPSPFVFIAFQAGPRTCLGQNFALLEMKATIARLLLLFDFTLAQTPESVTYASSLTLPIQGGLKVFVRELRPSKAA